ncbi:MAG: hypothetical protein EBQ84_15575 [Betaproteobacteria bacterium]|nr:hypothetical protein [Betaproteobacteria bacterium]
MVLIQRLLMKRRIVAELFFTKGSYKGIPANTVRIELMLDRFVVSKEAEDMNLPGYKFHKLKGVMKKEYAVSVTGQWRITFKFFSEDAQR